MEYFMCLKVKLLSLQKLQFNNGFTKLLKFVLFNLNDNMFKDSVTLKKKKIQVVIILFV